MRERDVVAAAFSEPAQRPQPVDLDARLAERRRSAVLPDDSRIDPMQRQQLERLCVFARGDVDLGSALPQTPDQRPEDEHVRRVGDVDPDPHHNVGETRFPPRAPFFSWSHVQPAELRPGKARAPRKLAARGRPEVTQSAQSRLTLVRISALPSKAGGTGPKAPGGNKYGVGRARGTRATVDAAGLMSCALRYK